MIPHVQRKSGSRNKIIGGVQSQWIQIPYPWVGNWRTKIPKKFSHDCESSAPHIKEPSLRFSQRDLEFPGHLTLKGSGIWLQEFHRSRWNRHTILGGHKVSQAPRPREKEHLLHRRLNQTYLQVFDSLLWRHGSAGAHHRDGGTGRSSPRGPPWRKPSYRSALTLP